MTDVVYDWVTADDLEQAIKIEEQGYPADEAASLDGFKYRQLNAPKLFLGAYLPSRILIGYVCATLSSSPTLTHASMSTHVPSASSVCIHSVCVDTTHRHKGIASALMEEYISRLRSSPEAYERILLISHEPLRPFYERLGFEWLGLSSVVHGPDPWYEMRLNLTPRKGPPNNVATTADEALSLGPGALDAPPPGLWAALQRSSTRARPAPRLLASFPAGVESLVHPHPPTDKVQNSNKYDLLCPRPGCASVILLAGAGEYVCRPSVQLEPPALLQQTPLLPPLPPPGEDTAWWRVAPSPMKFENIGFSRPAEGLPRPLKLLACAECDLGPIGWCEVQGATEFWVAVGRVGYRVE
ncbi:hypothetical protein H0H92_009466 [Tricholoma furcatifolium]|nr:hypothetical protein H0H92_009466 [Tricholoma furcatifolium]